MAHEYRATIVWKRNPARILPRAATAARTKSASTAASPSPASSSPSVVPLPFSREDAVDPEEMFVAALSNCHMLTFLDLARRAGFVVDSYEDEAVGMMERIAPQRMAITKVTLRPKIVFGGAAPDQAKLDELHHQAHELCFIANSVKTEVTVEARA